MRFRVFGKIISIPKKILIITGVLAAVGVALTVHFTSGGRELPMPEKAGSVTLPDVSETPGAGETLTPKPGKSGPATPEPTDFDTRMAVHITGAVGAEGVYRVEQGSIVEDVVLIAGGLTEDADTYYVNLAMKVNDGMRIHIPGTWEDNKSWLLDVGYASLSGSEAGSSPGSSLININAASVNELISLSGIGESTARDIIAFREEHGRFGSIEDIMKVPGIKEAKFNKIRKFITV